MSTRRDTGFTLIEALVALTIVAVALMACIKAAGNMNLQQDQLLKREYAQWSARNAANTVTVLSVFPGAQVVQTPCDQGPYRFICTVDITNTPNPNFRRVEVRVRDLGDADVNRHLARLVLFLSSAP